MVLEAIDSIRRQDSWDTEIILVDDGSTDNTAAEVNSRFPQIKQVRLNGVGPGPARNAGVEAAGGDVLMFLDSDDLWLEGHTQQLMDVINRGHDVAYGVTRTIDHIGGNEFLIPDNGQGMEGDCFEQLLRWCFLVPSSLAVSRKAFTTARGFDSIACGEDWTFFIRLSARFSFGFAGPAPITLRRLHKGSLCFLSDRKKLLAIIRHLVTVLENEPRATEAHRNYFSRLYDWTAANMTQWSTVQDWYLQMLKEEII